MGFRLIPVTFGKFMAKKKNYYAVFKGATPGIYNTWPEAQAQINGFPGAKYRGFVTREEAVSWMENPLPTKTTARKKATIKVESLSDEPDHRDAVLIYTDGGSINNPGPGGYGAVQIYGEDRKEYSGGYSLTTNNRMELMACIVALRKLEIRDLPVFLYSDSSYVVNGISKGWAKKWQKNNWLKSDKKTAANADLWEELLGLCQPLDIKFCWVKGHAGHPENERCDFLANGMARKSGHPEDKGYKP